MYLMKLLTCLAVLWCGALTVQADALGAFNNISRSYSADIVSYNQRAPRDIYKTHVVMSRLGIRMETESMFGDHAKEVYIQRFKDNSSWLVKPDKKTFAKLPVETEGETGEDAGEGGVMSTQACQMGEKNLKSKKIMGQKSFNGDEVIVWNCMLNGYVVEQYYSSYWAVVVKEFMPSGDVVELRNIKSVDFQEGFFSPSKRYRQVSIEEFLTGAPKLEPYSESGIN